MDPVIQGVILTPEKKIAVPGGDVFHAVRMSSNGFRGFGEAYFSFVDRGVIKGWKKHLRVTLNLMVPIGAIRFVLYDDREESITRGNFFDVSLSPDNYCRLTVPPKIWTSFCGVSEGVNMLLNIIDEEHSSDEAIAKPLDEIQFYFGLNSDS